MSNRSTFEQTIALPFSGRVIEVPLGLVVLLLCIGQVVLWGTAFGSTYSAPEIDSAEQFVWAFSLENGYWKHPPAPSWILHALIAWAGPSVALPFVAAQACIAIALALTWRLGCELMSPRRALIATALTSLVTYHNFGGDNFNHNSALLPFQAATVLLFYLATRRGGLHRWALMGLFGGLAMLVKYVALLPIAGLLLVVVLDRELHNRKVMAGLAVATVVFLMVLAPHAWWLHRTDFLPFRYAQSVTQPAPGFAAALGSVFDFLVIQGVRTAPLLIGLGWLMRRAWSSRELAASRAAAGGRTAAALPGLWSPGRLQASILRPGADSLVPAARATDIAHRDRLFLWVTAVAPLLFTVVFCLATRTELQSRWGTNAFLFSGLLALTLVKLPETDVTVQRALVFAAATHIVFALALTFGKTVLAESFQRPTRANFPGAVLAAEAKQVWSAHTAAPLRIVVSDIWLGGNIIANSPDRVAVLIDGREFKSPWVKEKAVSDCGALVLDDLTSESRAAPNAALDALMARAAFTGVWNLPWAVPQEQATAQGTGQVKWGVIEPKDLAACDLR